MTTPHLQEQLSALIAGELTEAEGAAAEAHLKQCAECRLQLERLRDLSGVLDANVEIEPSPDFVPRVMKSIDAENKGVRIHTKSRLAWLALAAVLVFVAFLLRFYKNTAPQPGPVTRQGPAVAPSKPAPPQVAEQKEPAPSPPVVSPPVASYLSADDTELIAHLDELQDMELIQNYDNLQELDTAILASQEEQVQ